MEKELLIKDTAGLHAVLASEIVKASADFDVKVTLIYKDKEVTANSVLALMSLAVPQGKNIKVIAEGKKAEEIIEEITKILS
ncbi:MAG: HPr family phosphocarrier protein [Candidatus Izimaplasma sp.]|nr:HPr family phosphocarrier protein [Candidatus Izimaplasma bacterium]